MAGLTISDQLDITTSLCNILGSIKVLRNLKKFSAGEGDERVVWWKMLKQLIEQEEKGNQSVLHYAVASALLQHSTLLPAWLVTSYKVSQLRSPPPN